MSGGGGSSASEKNSQQQFEYDNKKFAYDYQEMLDEDVFLQRNFDIKIQNQQDQIAFQNQTRAQEYQHKLNIANFDFNNQNKAYSASVKSYEEQLDYNEMAAEIAVNDTTRKYNEQLMDLAFQNEDLLMKLDETVEEIGMGRRHAEAATALEKKGIELDYEKLKGSVGLRRKGADLTHKEELANLHIKALGADLTHEEQLAALGIRSAGAKLTYGELSDSVKLKKSGASLTQSQLRDRAGLDRKGINQGYARIVDQLGIQKKGVRKQYRQTVGRAGLKRKGIALALHDAHKDANLQQRAAVLAMKGKRSDIARKMKETRLQGLMQAGQQRNLGQTGRSARRNLGNVLAKQGDAQAALTDLLMREESSYNLDLQKVSNTLTAASMRADLSFDEVATEVLHAQQDRDLSEQDLAQQLGHSALQHRLQLEEVDTGVTHGEERKSLTFSELEREQFYGAERKDLTDAEIRKDRMFARRQRDLTGKQIRKDVDFSGRRRAQTFSELASELSFGGKTRDLRRSGAEQALDRQMAQFRIQEGTARKRTKFNQQQIQETMKSAATQFEAENQQISLQRFQQDLAAQDRLAPAPKRPPVPPVPSTIPAPQFQRPPAPPSWERYSELKPIKGAVSKGPSGFQRALGMASGVMSIAAPFMFPSDDRLKRTYNRIGTSPSGVPIYTYKYIHDGEHGPWYKGTSAQDLLEIGRSDAVVQQEKDGFYYVDYSKLDVEFEKVTAT